MPEDKAGHESKKNVNAASSRRIRQEAARRVKILSERKTVLAVLQDGARQQIKVQQSGSDEIVKGGRSLL